MVAPKERQGMDQNRPLEDFGQAQRERLFFIDFRVLFIGDVRRSDLMDRFGIAEAAATRDLSIYRRLAPGNLDFDRSSKIYLAAPGFVPLFVHQAEHSLHALSEGVGDDAATSHGAHLRVERPIRPTAPDLGVVSAVARAISRRMALRIDYVSLSSGRSVRVIAPHALVDTGLRWHVRAWDAERARFGDFVLTRMQAAELAGHAPPEAERERDEQWMRIVPLELVPHPGLRNPDAVAADYGLKGEMLEVRLRAPLVGYVMQAWGVDTTPDHRLDPLRHQLWLRNTGTLYGVESLAIAPGQGQ